MIGNVEPCEHRYQSKEHSRNNCAGLYKLACLFLQRSVLIGSSNHSKADFPVFGLCTYLIDQHNSVALGNESARITIIFAPIILCRLSAFRRSFPNAFCLPSKGRFIHA